MTSQVAKTPSKLPILGPDAQSKSTLSADSARFATTLNNLLSADKSAAADPKNLATNINDRLIRKPAAVETPLPLRETDTRTDVVSKPRLTPEGELTQKARELVGATFYATLLKQMHDSPFKSELFSGGHGGEAFGGMYDQVLTQRMSQRGSERMVRPIVKKFKAAADAAYERQKNKTQKSLNEAKTDVPSNLRA